jgi:hypothetical protein
LPRPAADASASKEDVGGNMQAILRNLFGVHDVMFGVDGVINIIFSAFLKFVNQLLPDDGEVLLDNTYEAKKFLRDMV